jgi:hypothetical protein
MPRFGLCSKVMMRDISVRYSQVLDFMPSRYKLPNVIDALIAKLYHILEVNVNHPESAKRLM